VRGDKKSKGLFEVIPGWWVGCVHVFYLSLFVSGADDLGGSRTRDMFHPKAQPDHQQSQIMRCDFLFGIKGEEVFSLGASIMWKHGVEISLQLEVFWWERINLFLTVINDLMH
jgi:hypothetical protein